MKIKKQTVVKITIDIIINLKLKDNGTVEEKAVLVMGATMLLLGMGMNLQYALDDYGLVDNNAVVAVWAQITTGGTDPGGPPSDGWSSMTMECFNSKGQKTGIRKICFQPGYQSSCIEESCH